MGALLGVARGSHEPPKFIVLEYNGSKKKNERPVVLGRKDDYVRHGRHFAQACRKHGTDEGRHDRWRGSAGCRSGPRHVFELPLQLVGILPVAENMPGGRAMKPGDIVKTLSGKTVEVQNTDAEGRLILADGSLTHALQPGRIDRYRDAHRAPVSSRWANSPSAYSAQTRN